MLTILHAPYLMLIIILSTPRFCSLSVTSRHKQVTEPRDTTLHQETIETGQETLLRHQETIETGQETLLRHQETIETGQETLLRHQETACVQGEPQAKRHYSVIRRRPVSRESHRPRDITPSSGDGLCPGRATGQETLLRHQETACVQGEPQAKRHYSVIRRRPVSRESHRPRDITPSSVDGPCPGRATGQETLLRHQETARVQGEPQAKRHYSVIRRRPVSRESHRQYQ